MNYKRGYGKSRVVTSKKIEKMIENYPKQYKTPKYMEFIKESISLGWKVTMFNCSVSKYIFIVKDDEMIKVRFSNHKPLFHKEQEEDCDFYVGISHKQCSTTEEILEKIKHLKVEDGIKKYCY